MSDLKNIIISMIREGGPMNVGTFMGLALGHPQLGYYMNRDPFGAAGDFTTSPEISQMFGELLGLWAADMWMRMGKPDITLAEAGPGRGTLMADALRATKSLDDFKADVHLIETSPALSKIQAQTLEPYAVPVWHDHVGKLPADRPVILIANELLDALPIRQLQFMDGKWHERVIAAEGDALVWGLAPLNESQGLPVNAKDGDIFEAGPARNVFVAVLCALLQKAGGAALLIDYGHTESAYGDTLQAMKAHKYVDVLADPGEADVTSHVDFEAVCAIARQTGCTVYGPVTQGDFLHRLGIAQRAQTLKKKANADQAEEIDIALARLTEAQQMGTLFKVVAITAPGMPVPAGFDDV